MWMVINLNIAIDKTVRVDNFRIGKIYRYPLALTLAGGKGLNVARAAKTLGIKPEIWGFIGGYNGLWIKESLKKEGFKTRLFWHKNGESRICYSIVDKNGVSTDFNEDGCKVPENLQKEFIKRFKDKILPFSVVSISGRTLPNLKKGFYSQLVKFARSKGIKVYVDLSGKPLLECVLSGAEVVKINNLEFEEFFGEKFSKTSILNCFERFKSRGLKTLIVTNKSKPFYCCENGRLLMVTPPDISRYISSPVGAGDSFMSGLIFSSFKKYDLSKSLKFATACAVSDCFSLGAGLISFEEINAYFKKIKVEIIKG